MQLEHLRVNILKKLALISYGIIASFFGLIKNI